MADPNLAIHDHDIRFEDRDGCFVLVDPARDGSRDVGTMWPTNDGRYAVRFELVPPSPTPLTVLPLEAGMRLLLDAYRIHDRAVGAKLDEQEPRLSFGFPQIVPAPGNRTGQ